jgi:hypothetical protein
MLSLRVAYGVDMELGCWWFAREFTQTLDELLLSVIVDIILRAEEYNTALRN